MEDVMILWPTTHTLSMVQESGPLPNALPGMGTGGAVGSQPVPGGEQLGGQGGASGGQPTLFTPFFTMMLLLVIFMIVTTMMSSRREKKRMAEMLSSLKRGDRVLTLGGLIGTVHEVREDSIVLRVDDVSGAKAHFTRNAVQRVLKSAKSSGSDVTDEAVSEAG